MARFLKGSHSFTCTARIHPLTEWTIPALAFPAEAGTHLPTPEGWKLLYILFPFSAAVQYYEQCYKIFLLWLIVWDVKLSSLTYAALVGMYLCQVRCLSCFCTSRMCEPFMDLSLEFPDRYHAHGTAVRTCHDTCALEGMITLLHCLSF